MLWHQCRRLETAIIRRSSRSVSQLLSNRPINTWAISHRAKEVISSPAGKGHGYQARYPIAQRLYSAASSGLSDLGPTTTSSLEPPTPQLPEKPDYLNDAESAIWDSLVAAFSPTELTVQDISGGCGSMYGIEIASEKFRGLNLLKQQRMVNAVLGDRMKDWHGIQLRTRVPLART
ncbi:bola-like protein [Durotheca rogersii]|uniref:bola-like protein n=1 Tax=Durotheca rogersii TaxID=419775 RepID=UPI00222038B5|nr:bola-like protein [Durotheca rogersii]KAI5863323.1 bola-like protein [Durotheca rogersii]